MKPRTKLQFQVLDLSKHLPVIENKMLEWAKISVLKHIGYATKNRVICMDCGERFSSEIINRKRATCPHCDQKLIIEQTRASTSKQVTFIAYAQLVDDFQVIRNFEVRSYHKAGRKTRYFIWEVLQHWYLNDKKREVIARNHSYGWHGDNWNGNMEIRNKSIGRYWENNKYDVYPEKYHPGSIFKTEYCKYGINHKLQELTFLEAVKILPDNPHAETLLKSKQYSLVSKFRTRSEESKINRYWSSIKICLRNKYQVKDAGIWIDYLDLLDYFGKDLHNAHYVCPKDLKTEHDRLMIKKRAIQRTLELERRKADTIKQEKAFKEKIERFADLNFFDGLIFIKVLESVEEYAQEGDKLHHCVFTNNYFSKPDSLVLSARIENEPVETIEISLKDFRVLQSRGKYNSVTEHHDRIVDLVNKNIKHIRKRTKEKQTA